VMKRYVALSERVDASLSGGHGGGGGIDPHDFATFADQFRRHQRSVAPAAADVQHSHTLLDTCVPIILPSKWIYELGLEPKALQFSFGMSQLVFVCVRAFPLACHRTLPRFYGRVTLRSNDAKNHAEIGNVGSPRRD